MAKAIKTEQRIWARGEKTAVAREIFTKKFGKVKEETLIKQIMEKCEIDQVSAKRAIKSFKAEAERNAEAA